MIEKFVKNLVVENDTLQTWITKGGTFVTNKKCLTNFVLDEFYENRQIQWNLYVDSSSGPHKYDMIIGRDLLSELGITLNFSDQTMTWDESTVRMKDPEEFADISSPLHEFFWHCESYETQALQDASARLKKILDAKYAPADPISMRSRVNACIWQMTQRQSFMTYSRSMNIYLMAHLEYGIMNLIILN